MPINQPGRGDVHVDRPLTQISLAFLQSPDGFVADRVFPRVPVSKQSDSYFRYDRDMFNRNQMEKRAPGAESAGATYSIDTDTYNADVWALHHDIADQIRANADSPLQLDRETTEFLTIQSLIRREKSWADDNFVASVWTGDLTGVSGAPTAPNFQQWNEDASTPIEDVRRGARNIQFRTGFRPNKFVCNRDVFDALLDHPDIVGRLDRGQTQGAAMVLKQNLAALFEVEEVLVMDAIEATSAEGATVAHALIGAKQALLVYSAPSPGLMTPSGGYTFTWTGLLGGGVLGSRIKRMRMEHLESDRLEIQQAFDQKLVAADLGQMYLTAVA